MFVRLGLTSFGGPVAHLAYFRAEFVERRGWLSARDYADLVALCQFLPGPASSQVGMALGLFRHGLAGALAAWAGFTLPSAIALILFALGLAHHPAAMPTGALHGLKVVSVAVVAQAVWAMARSLCPDAPRLLLMGGAACITLLAPSTPAQIGIIIGAGVLGRALFAPPAADAQDPLPVGMGRGTGVLSLALFCALLAGLPVLAALVPNPTLAAVSAFFRSGALVFGGGHVVLPVLQAAVVPPGWVSRDVFLAGYGATQAMPGPLFTFAAFLGASMPPAFSGASSGALSGPLSGWVGGVVCLLAICAPSFLLVVGVLPFWERLRHDRRAQAALTGINAAVVGLLLAALYTPVWTGAIHTPTDIALATAAFITLTLGKAPPWLVVLGCGLAGWLFSLMG